MKFCEADAFPTCALPEDSPVCLRQKAKFCAWLVPNISSDVIRAGLEKMSHNLIEDANALEQVQKTSRKSAGVPSLRDFRQTGKSCFHPRRQPSVRRRAVGAVVLALSRRPRSGGTITFRRVRSLKRRQKNRQNRGSPTQRSRGIATSLSWPGCPRPALAR